MISERSCGGGRVNLGRQIRDPEYLALLALRRFGGTRCILHLGGAYDHPPGPNRNLHIFTGSVRQRGMYSHPRCVLSSLETSTRDLSFGSEPVRLVISRRLS